MKIFHNISVSYDNKNCIKTLTFDNRILYCRDTPAGMTTCTRLTLINNSRRYNDIIKYSLHAV